MFALPLVLFGEATGFADIRDGADDAGNTAIGQAHGGLADDDVAFRAVRGDDCGFVPLHVVRVKQQFAFLRGVARGGFGVEQVLRGLADPVFARPAGEPLPGAIEQHVAALRILAKDRTWIEFDQVLGQLHLVREGARGLRGHFLGPTSRPGQHPDQAKKQE